MNRLKRFVVNIGMTLLISFLGLGISVLADDPFSFQVKVDKDNNAIDLSWSEPDKKEPYVYKVYQKKEGDSEFQSISTADLKERVHVLNVYPGVGPDISYTTWDGEKRTIPKSGVLEMWMEAPNPEHPKGYGMGLIEVDPVPLADFNANPEKYLKNSDGSWKYDTVFFGSWDCNGACRDYSSDTSAEAIPIIQSFAASGRGVLFGHDVLDHSYHPNFQKLQPLINYKPGGTSIGHTEVMVAKKGLLTQYPWKIGDVGTKLKVPMSHQGGIAGGDTWFMYTDDTWKDKATEEQLKDPRINHYLTTWNNAAYIATGHSNGEATPDEQKIIANTLFYLSQLTTNTSHKDRSGIDLASPDKIQNLTYDPKTNTVSFPTPNDNGTTYEYYVEAIGSDTGVVKKSSVKRVVNTSGIAGYSYVIDNNPTTIPDNIIDTTSNQFKLDFSKGNGDYLHIISIDAAGNPSEPVHIDISEPRIVIRATPSIWTNDSVVLSVEGKGYGLSKIRLPNGIVVNGRSATFTVSNNGVYTVHALDQNGKVITVSSYVVDNIDRTGKKGYVIPNDRKWRNHDVEVEIRIEK